MSSSEEVGPDGGTTSAVGVVPDDERPERLTAAVVGPAYATWGQRVVAAILDDAILAGITWLALGAGIVQPTLTPVLTPAAGAAGSGPLILIPIGAVVILLVLQALTGWPPGKLVVGVRVLRERSSVPAGLWTTLVRWVLHLLDAVLLIGYLRPLWHAKRQTFADSIARTVVVQGLPDLPRRQRITVYSAALVVCVLGLGYCLPISSGGSSSAEGVTCEATSSGPLLTSGDITLAGSMSLERERRLWTVRETRTVHPGATVSWTNDPSVRDVDYRIELEARPSSADGEPVVSRSWDIGTGGTDNPSEDGSAMHTREISPRGDTHVAVVELAEDAELADAAEDLRALGTHVWTDVRLVADGEVLAECGGAVDHGAGGDRSS